ncbi:hypothetical protein BN2537_5709 [Streptomyces venezuelae]|nr:hypothetical protein BN2537_5709 [Streptomyces venezuelae]
MESFEGYVSSHDGQSTARRRRPAATGFGASGPPPPRSAR